MNAHRTSAIVMLAVALVFVLAAPALAMPAGAKVVSTTKTTVSGVDVATQVLRNMDKVALGSTGATVTLDIEGETRDIGVDLRDLNPESGGGVGFGGIAAIAAVAAGIFKGAALLTRLVR